jgi:hypothetical protein
MSPLSSLREAVSLMVSAVLAEKRRRRRKPGGPRTDMGALRQIDPGAFTAAVSSAMQGAGGDVEDAAGKLDVAPRTLYHYLDTDSSLSAVRTSTERDDDGRRKDSSK